MNFPIDLSPILIKKAQELGVEAFDIEEKFITGGGSGGQKINKTASCVQLKHLPSGTLVKCQKHREQSKNRLSAYKMLILKIEEKIKGKESEKAKKIFKLKKQKAKRSKRAKEKILADKAHRSEIKETRKDLV
ncbi:peptide chain release factor-like protein [Candidatus Peregrinibacteria bacterium CG10_big_fil_rev_8_21_14_0_10_36_19]|nr:MAG: peptide chain release factor-like protein [Candidatus Peregrinibacteria bacterium CG10_big_fil_rev_8_21_14_0_10_36_19]